MKQLDWQSPVKVGDVEVPVIVGREGDKGGTLTVAVYSWSISRLPGSNTGHGHVWERPDCRTVECGGPPDCDECQIDADLVVEMLKSINGAAAKRPAPRAQEDILRPARDERGRAYVKRLAQ